MNLPTTDPDAPWARTTIDRATWLAAAIGLTVWQLGLAVLAAARGGTPGAVLLAHLVVALLTLGILGSIAPIWPRVLFSGALVLLLSADLAWSEDPLTRTVVAMSFLVAATPFLMLPWWVATAVVGPVLALGASIVGVTQGRGPVVAMVLPTVCFALCAAALARRLAGHADLVDRRLRDSGRSQERLAEAGAEARAVAEQARTLHDTVVNTLGVLAWGGRAVADRDRVRARCRADVRRVERMMAERLPGGQDPDSPTPGIRLPADLQVRWRGPGEEVLSAVLGAARWTAMAGILEEALRNVAKHAGTDRAEVCVTLTPDRAEVTVRDHGVGFLPDDALRGPGLGLRESVLARAGDHGLTVEVASAPGAGTRVVVAAATGPEPDRSEAAELAEAADAVARDGAWAWCVGVATASALTALVGPATPATYASTALVVALSAGCRWLARGGPPPRLAAPVIAACVPLCWTLGFLGATAPGSDPALWPGIGIMPLLLLLLVVLRSRAWFGIALAALVVSALVVARVEGPAPGIGAELALANAGLHLAQGTIWLIFLGSLGRITEEAARLQRRHLADRTALATLRGAARVQRIWREAQVSAALDVLRDVGSGLVAVDDPGLPARASREEHYLRQLLLLPASLVHLGPWLARALAASRTRGVTLTLRVGSDDVADAATAEVLGTVMLAAIDVAAPGDSLVLAHFSEDPHPLLTVVGPAGWGPRVLRVVATRAAYEAEVLLSTTHDQDLLEVRVSGADTPVRGRSPRVDPGRFAPRLRQP